MRRQPRFGDGIAVERVLDLGRFGVQSLAWLPDGESIATQQGGVLAIYDASDGVRRAEFAHSDYQGRFGDVGTPLWSPNGRRLIELRVSSFRLFDLETSTFSDPFEGHDAQIRAAEWVSTGSDSAGVIVTASDDTFVATWDPERAALLRSFEGHDAAVDFVTATCTADGALRIASVSRADRTIRIWDGESGTERLRLASQKDGGHPWQLAWTPGGETLVALWNDGGLRVVDIASERIVEATAPWSEGPGQIAFTANGELLVQARVGYQRGRLRVWRVADWTAHADALLDYDRFEAHARDGEFAVHPNEPRIAITLGYSDVAILDLTEVASAPIADPATPTAGRENTTPPELPTIIIPGSEPEEAPVSVTPSDEPELFDVFLCHNSQDKPVVRKVDEHLRARGIRTWLDERELRPGLPWQEALQDQIASIRAAAVMVGQQGFGPWQNRELASFLTQFNRRGCPVIPVILEDCEETPELPLFLAEMTWVDFRLSDPDPIDRLIWGITGQRSRG